LSERSEFIFPPDLRLSTPGTLKGLRTSGRLSLLTFFGEAKKVSGCRAAPANQSRPKKEKNELRMN